MQARQAVQVDCVQHGAYAGVGEQRREDLVRYKGPTLGAYGVGQDSRRCHSPAPARLGGDVRVDGARIAHVVDATTEECLHGGAEVEGHHAGGHCAHTGCLHTRCRRLVRSLGFEIIAAVAAEGYRQDSSASIGTGTGCHRIVGRCERRGLSMREEQRLNGSQVKVFHVGWSPATMRTMDGWAVL